MQGWPYHMVDLSWWYALMLSTNYDYGYYCISLWIPTNLVEMFEGKELTYVVTLCGLSSTTSSGLRDTRTDSGSTMSTLRRRRERRNYQLNGSGSSSKVHLCQESSKMDPSCSSTILLEPLMVLPARRYHLNIWMILHIFNSRFVILDTKKLRNKWAS